MKKPGVSTGISSVTVSRVSSMRVCQFCPQAMSLRSWKMGKSWPICMRTSFTAERLDHW